MGTKRRFAATACYLVVFVGCVGGLAWSCAAGHPAPVGTLPPAATADPYDADRDARRLYIVQRGDSTVAIAETQCGDWSVWRRIRHHPSGMPADAHIRPGDVLLLPPDCGAAPAGAQTEPPLPEPSPTVPPELAPFVTAIERTASSSGVIALVILTVLSGLLFTSQLPFVVHVVRQRRRRHPGHRTPADRAGGAAARMARGAGESPAYTAPSGQSPASRPDEAPADVQPRGDAARTATEAASGGSSAGAADMDAGTAQVIGDESPPASATLDDVEAGGEAVEAPADSDGIENPRDAPETPSPQPPLEQYRYEREPLWGDPVFDVADVDADDGPDELSSE